MRKIRELDEIINQAFIEAAATYTVIHNDNESNILHVSFLAARAYLDKYPATQDIVSEKFLAGAIYEKYVGGFITILREMRHNESQD